MAQSYFQIRANIKDITPQPWRRLMVKSSSTFHELHHILQIAFGWENNHLYDFHYEGYNIGIQLQDDIDNGKEVISSREVTLVECIRGAGETIEYVYDFEDYWRHHIRIEEVVKGAKRRAFPVCLDGACSRPPESCGGPPGYRYLQEVLSDHDHPDYQNMRSWLGYDLNPDFFDRKLVNRAYKNLSSYIKFFDND